MHFNSPGIANMLGLIKMAKYFEWTENDFAFTLATDSVVMYQSRLEVRGGGDLILSFFFIYISSFPLCYCTSQ